MADCMFAALHPRTTSPPAHSSASGACMPSPGNHGINSLVALDHAAFGELYERQVPYVVGSSSASDSGEAIKIPAAADD